MKLSPSLKREVGVLLTKKMDDWYDETPYYNKGFKKDFKSELFKLLEKKRR